MRGIYGLEGWVKMIHRFNLGAFVTILETDASCTRHLIDGDAVERAGADPFEVAGRGSLQEFCSSLLREWGRRAHPRRRVRATGQGSPPARSHVGDRVA